MNYPQSQNSPETTIIRFLSAVRNRIRLDISLKWLMICAIISIFISGALFDLERLFDLPFPAFGFFIAALLLTFLVSTAKFYLIRPQLFEVAKDLDIRLKLKERLSSAIEIIDLSANTNNPVNPIASLQIRDAATYAINLNPKTSHPYQFLKLFKLFSISLIPLLIFPLIPQRSGQTQNSPEVRKTIAEEGKTLVKTSEDLNSDDLRIGQLPRTIELLSEEMMDLGNWLKTKNPSKKEALRGISELSAKIQTEGEKLRGKDSSKILDLISKSLNSAGILEKNQPASPSETVRELADKVGLSQIDPDLKRKLELLLQDLAIRFNESSAPEDLRNQLQALQSKPLNAADLRKLSESLENFEKNQLELKALQHMLAQLQSSKSKIGMSGLNLDLNIESEGKIAKRQPSPGDESTNLQTIGGKTEPSTEPSQNSPESIGDQPQNLDDAKFKLDYYSSRLNKRGSELELEGSESQNGRRATIYSREKPEGTNYSFIPYQKVYRQYRSAADDAISKERIPLQHRNLIKSYFDAINPQM